MSLHKRGGIYHCDFVMNGERYRQTLETTDWREATQRQNDLKARARDGKLASGIMAQFSRLLFCAALDRYLVERAIRSQAPLPAGAPGAGEKRSVAAVL